MLTQEQINSLRTRYGFGDSSSTVAAESPQDRIARLRSGVTSQMSWGQETLEDLKQTWQNLKSNVLEGAEDIEGVLERKEEGRYKTEKAGPALSIAAAGAKTGFKSFNDLLIGGIKALLPDKTEKKVKDALTKIVTAPLTTNMPLAKEGGPLDVPALEVLKKEVFPRWQKLKKENPDAALRTEAAVEAVMAYLDLAAAKGVYQAGRGAVESTAARIARLRKSFGKTIGEGADTIKNLKAGELPAAGSLTEKAVEAVRPTPTAGKAASQIMKGAKPDEVLRGGAVLVKMLEKGETSARRTFAELVEDVVNAGKRRLRAVDEDLLQSTIKTKLDDFVQTVGRGKNAVKFNPVKEALKNLEEVYTNKNAFKQLTEIKDIIKKAEVEGLLNKEVNDLARRYAAEFRSFSPTTGKPLTSVSKQAYENTRTQLKEIARSGIGGAEAKIADAEYGVLKTVERYLNKNVQAVHKAQTIIAERGLVEKVGYYLTKYLDKLSGGSIRGLVSGALGRGKGYHTLQILDLENALSRNLQILKRIADKNLTDDEIIDLLRSLTFSEKKADVILKKQLSNEYDKIKPLAEEAQKEIVDIANNIVERYGGRVADNGIKSRDSWVRKVATELEGDVEKITDTARLTIVNDKSEKIYNVLLDEQTIIKSDFKYHNTEKLGFEGGNIRIEAANGVKSEIQVVSPDIIFAKEPAKVAKRFLGEELYNSMLKKYGNIGGRGHKLYEKWRVLDKVSLKAKNLAEESRKYYNQFITK